MTCSKQLGKNCTCPICLVPAINKTLMEDFHYLGIYLVMVFTSIFLLNNLLRSPCRLSGMMFKLQTEVFKILHSMLVSTDSRDSCLSFMASILQRNHRKAQLQVSQNINSINTASLWRDPHLMQTVEWYPATSSCFFFFKQKLTLFSLSIWQL